MENSKKIIALILPFLVLTCVEKVTYFNEQHERIRLPEGFRRIKLNLFIDSRNNTYFVTQSKVFYNDHDTIKIKNEGLLLQDSIFDINFNSLFKTSEIVDTATYEELDKNLVYKDKKNVYFNRSSEQAEYPFYILDLSAANTILLNGGYIKDRRSVYHYGFQCMKLENADAATFDVIKLRDTVDNSIFYIGKDKGHLYRHDSEMDRDDLRYLRISRQVRDSLAKYIE